MSTPTSPAALRLTHAGQQLREQLRQLEDAGQQPAPPLGGLLAAFDDYERAVLACVPPVPAWQANPDPTPAELLAEREAEPLYRLGWVRGYQQGQADGQQQAEPALNLYARHAALPAPIDPTALMQQVRRFITQLQQRYGAGPISHYPAHPAA